jgi:hypothetical protein
MLIVISYLTLPASAMSAGAYQKIKIADDTTNVYVLAMGANTGLIKRANSDATNFSATVNRLFSPFYHVMLQLYPSATVKNFQDGMNWLKDNVRQTDTVIIFYSGHGSTLPDDNGDEQDYADEVFVMVDANATSYPDVSDVVRDDQFAKWINMLPTQRVIVILDACHAGGLVSDRLARDKFFSGGMLGVVNSFAMGGIPDALDLAKGVAVSAAREGNAAFENDEGGLLTTTLLREMKALSNSGKSWYEIIQVVSDVMQHQTGTKVSVIGNAEILRGISVIDY